MARALIACMGAMAPQVPVTAWARGRPPGRCLARATGCQGKLPRSSGRGAAPVWGHPRQRDAVRRPRPREHEAATRRIPRQVGSQPPDLRRSTPSRLTASASSPGTQAKNLLQSVHSKSGDPLLTLAVISTLPLSGGGRTPTTNRPAPPRHAVPLAPRPLQCVVRQAGRAIKLASSHAISSVSKRCPATQRVDCACPLATGRT